MSSTRHALPYRPDIDGMRALAVVPVCFYHLDLPGFSGGFAGVDVFFVISGYLMAALIGRDLMAGHFSLAEFYERRARRLLPALFVVLSFCSAAAAIVVSPKLFRDFGATLLAAVCFSSNLLFWRKSANYFDAPTDWNLLVHTWSLGVEEQFYILFPLALMIAWRFGWRVRWAVTAIAAATSLALSIWATQNAPTAAFYLLPSRAWELLCGALLAFWSLGQGSASSVAVSARQRRIDSALGVAGLAAILWSLTQFDREMPFPGAAALLPCAGTLLLLHSGREGSTGVTRILSLRPMLFTGRISYSLYLWHWPLIVLVGRYFSFGSLGTVGRLSVLDGSVLAAYLSWRWIEQPFRTRHGSWTTKKLITLATACTAALAAVGGAAIASDGWPGRFPGIAAVSLERQLAAESGEQDWHSFTDTRCFVVQVSDWKASNCLLSRHAGATALLWGDSFAAAYAYGFFRSPGANLNVLQYTSPQCPPIMGYRAASRPQCAAFNANVADILRRNNIGTVIMAANWSVYLKRRKVEYADIAATVAALQRMQVRVVLVGQSPVFPFAYPDEYFFRKFGGDEAGGDYSAPVDLDPGINRHLAQVAGANAFFDPLLLFCHNSLCLFRRQAHYLFADYGHYSQFGSATVVRALLRTTEGTLKD